MPGLTIATGAAAQQPHAAASSSSSNPQNTATTTQGASFPTPSMAQTPAQPQQTPIPPPQLPPAQQTQQPQQPQQPPRQPPRRPSSPPHPPMSPITPPGTPVHLAPTATGRGTNYAPNFAAERTPLTHVAGAALDADATALPASAPSLRPLPLDFSANPDALALQSAIAILQLQKRRAAADIAQLHRAKEAAMADPEGFARALAAGRVPHEPDPLFLGRDDDDDEEDEDEDEEMEGGGGTKKKNIKKQQQRQQQEAQFRLPRPQNVVRMPPVNWSKYAVVGDALDKLHAEQVARPPQGSPAVLQPDGTYAFRGASAADSSSGSSRAGGGLGPGSGIAGLGGGGGGEYLGVAAPYSPTRDKLDKKQKGVAKR